ncbi:Kojibiose phosphorylase [Catenulispora acidiphila DSM 44928]|uniref:Kojibiose phosphorylase n=1 Tax=Catenulispora acidiphila (strain DSM 44928 / JCM 14897 / NBRC 102108 / NRRL B-24433 / ID139908) TaxID=479433 RepID=C7PWH9_CATAD|nr:glycosyl hydrolase family 65 protein [Catenulispora acidiphila]ACU75259.1 Kojibiose phosphorylase [Catenulispora acidiphila DSM 44928]
MIGHPFYAVEPWSLRETEIDLDVLGQSESVFALGNGHIGWRGNLDEGEPHGLPGAYLNGVYESRPLPYAEAGYGDPEAGQTVINVTNGKVIRLLVDDAPFDLRYGRVLDHERVLDFRTGLLERRVTWESPMGKRVKVHSSRLVSLVQRSVAAICYEVEAVDTELWVVLQSELVANEALPDGAADPRVAAVLKAPLVPEENSSRTAGGLLVHRTAVSGLRIAAAMDHHIQAPPSLNETVESFEDLARYTVTAVLKPGERLRLIKYVTYGWSQVRSEPAVRAQVEGALAGAVRTGWEGLVDQQRTYLDDFWARADVEVEGDAEIQQAVRFALFHVLQAGARAEHRAIPAKGLTGTGYDGHAFWDTETFVLPMLTYIVPQAAGDALRWRYDTLPLAKERARQLGLKGAAFPWRTITGAECSGYWPAGTAAFHIDADIAAAAVRYVGATGDTDFEKTIGLELLIQTARLWRSLGHHDGQGRFRIDGVTGPDEYSAIADNNVYTNLMAQHNLVSAATVAERYSDRALESGVDAEEVASWRDAAAAMYIPYDDVLGVHPQAEGFTSHEMWDFAGTPPEKYPLLLHFPYFDLYRKQVVKQADLVLAMALRGEAFTDEQKSRNFAYYEALTVRDSSLSACTQAVMAAEVGHLQLAGDYLAEAALMDLDDLQHNTRDGLHVASLAGTWVALVAGLAGMREHEGTLSFKPRLPSGITRLAVNLSLHASRLRVEITANTVTYQLQDGSSLRILHHDEPIDVTADTPITRPIARIPPAPPLHQPPGRAPLRRDAPQ